LYSIVVAKALPAPASKSRGSSALNGEWPRAKGLLESLATAEIDQPNIWAFGAALRAGHLNELLAILEQTGADERWRPLYEALPAIKAGSAQYLRRIAPEVRSIAERIVAKIAPDLK
jgi:hypothetical protein